MPLSSVLVWVWFLFYSAVGKAHSKAKRVDGVFWGYLSSSSSPKGWLAQLSAGNRWKASSLGPAPSGVPLP